MSSNLSPRVLITGRNGQVGRELAKRAAELAIDFVAFDSSELDIRDRAAVLAAVEKHQPTAVINAAAYTAVDKAEEEKELAYAVNRDGVENLALACKVQDIPLIHISTDYVFDGEKGSPYVESDTPKPIGVYGASKYAGEEVLRATWGKHIIVRVSWVFGHYGNNFVKTMLRLAKSRDELGVVVDQIGGPTYAGDISRALVHLACQFASGADMKWGVFNYSGYPFVSWHQFACEIFSQAEKESLLPMSMQVNPITTAQYPTPAKRPANSCLDCSGMLDTYGIQPCDWRQALVGLSFYMSLDL